MAGTLYGVGLGPGDPELVTVKAARLIAAAGVVAYHSARHGRSIARTIAEPYLTGDQIEEPLVYPVTTETTDHPGGYEGAIEDFYTSSAARLMAHLEAGSTAQAICAGSGWMARSSFWAVSTSRSSCAASGSSSARSRRCYAAVPG